MFDYEDLLEILEEEGHCVLFIGPEFNNVAYVAIFVYKYTYI